MSNPVFDRLDQAASKALARQNKVFGFQGDPSLAQYEQLDNNDFDVIAQTYGQEALMQYIQAMESRRLKGAPNGVQRV